MSTVAKGYSNALRWFTVGIVLAFIFVLYSAFSGHSYTRMQLVVYDLLAILHILVVFGVAFEAGERAPAPRVAQVLYTAGFIHTLLAIGLALLSMTHLLLGEGSVELRRLLDVIVPLGAAVIPHAFAVFLGLLCESSIREDTPGPDDFFRALAEDARRAGTTLSALYSRRAQAIEEEIRQIGEVTAGISRLGGAADNAVTTSTHRIVDIEHALTQLTSQVAALAGDLQKAYANASASVGALGGSAATVAKSIQQAAPAGAELASELAQAADTVRKLNELQRAIVELIAATSLGARK